MKNGKSDFEKAFIFAVLFATLACISIGTVSAAATHYVNPGELIQGAVDNATTGDIIIVRDGTYTENVDLNVTNLTIKSENGSTCCSVHAASASDHVFEVTADYVNITGFTSKGATGYENAGIYLDGVEHCEISDNKASNNYDGIFLSSSSSNILTNNTANSNNYDGIFLSYSSNNSLTNNTANSKYYTGIRLSYSSNNSLTNNTANSNNAYGIFLSYSSSNILTNNTANSNDRYGIFLESSSNSTLNNNMMSGNTYNFGVYSRSLSGYIQNIGTSNTVDGKPVYYWISQQDKQIPDDAGYVGVVNSTNITVKDLTLSHNDKGVLFVYTNNSKIENVSATNNDGGICLYSSSNNSLTGNNASNNYYGIHLYSSSNNNLTGNIVNSNTYYGIWLDHSSNNNTFTGNIANANYENGISLYSSSNNSLMNNTANSNNHNGIFLESSSNSTLNNNTMSGNTYNFGVYSGDLPGYTQNIDTSNTVDGKPVYYWISQQDNQIPDDAGYVGVVNSTNITVKDLTLSHNGEGVLFVYTTNSKIENVSATNNHDGITLYSSSNNSLTNNTANSNGNGIGLRSSSNNTLTSNTANSNYYDGITLYSSSNNTLTNNTANNSNDRYGIHLDSSSNNTLTGNTANSNYENGIYLYSSSYSTLNNNTMSGNTYNFGVYSGDLPGYTQNIDTSNTVDGKPVYYWISQQDKQIPDDAGYVGVVNSTNITVKDLTLSHNGKGVLFVYTNNSKIENVSASNNYAGIWLDHSSNNTLTNNTANSNYYLGILLYSSSNNSLTGNIANSNYENGIYLYSSRNNSLMKNTANSNSDYGIYLFSSSNNLICNNYFNNTNNARDSGNNTWNSTKTAGTNIIGGAYIGGNYWSDYAGEDTDGDGLGDTQIPYNSSGKIEYGGDYLPLVQASASSVFDTGTGTYPSIQGTHEGAIIPSGDIEVSKMYTYPCAGTGGHTKSIEIYEDGDLKASGNWSGYQEDWQNITITPSVTLKAGREYRYVIETGSYPQIIHVHEYPDATGGTITCDKFTDVNGKVYSDWIPAIRLS